MAIKSPGMGRYPTDDDPADTKEPKSGYYRGGVTPPANFKPAISWLIT